MKLLRFLLHIITISHGTWAVMRERVTPVTEGPPALSVESSNDFPSPTKQCGYSDPSTFCARFARTCSRHCPTGNLRNLCYPKSVAGGLITSAPSTQLFHRCICYGMDITARIRTIVEPGLEECVTQGAECSVSLKVLYEDSGMVVYRGKVSGGKVGAGGLGEWIVLLSSSGYGGDDADVGYVVNGEILGVSGDYVALIGKAHEKETFYGEKDADDDADKLEGVPQDSQTFLVGFSGGAGQRKTEALYCYSR